MLFVSCLLTSVLLRETDSVDSCKLFNAAFRAKKDKIKQTSN